MYLIIFIYLFIVGCVLFYCCYQDFEILYIKVYVCVTNRNVKTFINYIFLMDSKEQLHNSLMMRPFLMYFKNCCCG